MPTTYFNHTKGMCGTWDHDRTNEYLTPQGTIEPNTNLFGNHWKLQKTCRDEPENFTNPCDNNPKGQEQAKKYCAYLKGDVFKRELSPVVLCSLMHCSYIETFFSLSLMLSLFLHFSIIFSCFFHFSSLLFFSFRFLYQILSSLFSLFFSISLPTGTCFSFFVINCHFNLIFSHSIYFFCYLSPFVSSIHYVYLIKLIFCLNC